MEKAQETTHGMEIEQLCERAADDIQANGSVCALVIGIIDDGDGYLIKASMKGNMLILGPLMEHISNRVKEHILQIMEENARKLGLNLKIKETESED